MLVLKTGEDHMKNLDSRARGSFSNSGYWSDEKGIVKFYKTGNGEWRIAVSDFNQPNLSILKSQSFSSRKVAIKTAETLIDQNHPIDLSKLVREKNIVYNIKQSPLYVQGSAGGWACEVSHYYTDINNKVSDWQKYGDLRNIINTSIMNNWANHQKPSPFVKPTRKAAIDFLIDWTKEHQPKFFEGEAWAFKQA